MRAYRINRSLVALKYVLSSSRNSIPNLLNGHAYCENHVACFKYIIYYVQLINTLIVLSSPHVTMQSCLLGWAKAISFTPPMWASIYNIQRVSWTWVLTYTCSFWFKDKEKIFSCIKIQGLPLNAVSILLLDYMCISELYALKTQHLKIWK